jgi:aminopeptidase
MLTAFDKELAPGARNAIRVCLNVQPHERVTVVADRECEDIAASLVHEIEAVGAPYEAFILEDMAPRPLANLPPAIAADMEQSQVSILAVHVQPNELKSRMQLTDIVNRRKMRHGHMVNINRQMMLEGMRADFHKVDRLSQKVIDIVRNARTIRGTTKGGSDFTASLNPDYRWVKTSGLISPDKWGNLPGGEVFTTPGNVDGTLVIDGVVGEFAIGTNIELTQVIGHILQDEKFPGIHIAFGDPYGAHTGAQWTSTTHIDVVATRFDIWVDDRQIMADGKFLIE